MSLLVVAGGGCGSQALVSLRVDNAFFQRLPPQVRAVADREARDVAMSREDQRRALDELAAARTAGEALAGETRGAEATLTSARAAVTDARDDTMKLEQARHDLAVAETGVSVQQARAAWVNARLRWRELAFAAAELRVAVAEANLELTRATILLRFDSSTEVESFRGQHARLHQRWSASRAVVTAAHLATDRSERELAAVKTRYAQARTEVLPRPAVAPTR